MIGVVVDHVTENGVLHCLKLVPVKYLQHDRSGVSRTKHFECQWIEKGITKYQREKYELYFPLGSFVRYHNGVFIELQKMNPYRASQGSSPGLKSTGLMNGETKYRSKNNHNQDAAV